MFFTYVAIFVELCTCGYSVLLLLPVENVPTVFFGLEVILNNKKCIYLII